MVIIVDYATILEAIENQKTLEMLRKFDEIDNGVRYTLDEILEAIGE